MMLISDVDFAGVVFLMIAMYTRYLIPGTILSGK